MKAVKDVLAASTAHGISRAAATKSIPLRIMWSLLFVVFLTLFFISARSLIDRLVNITVVTNHETDKVPFEFPDLYFCPSLAYSGSIPYSLKESEAKLVNDEVARLSKLYDKLYCKRSNSCRSGSFYRVPYIQQSLPVQLMQKYLLQNQHQAFLLLPYTYSQSFLPSDAPTLSVFIQPNNQACFKMEFSDRGAAGLNYKRTSLFTWPFVDPYYASFNYNGSSIKPIVNPYNNETVPFHEWTSMYGYQYMNSLGYNLLIVPKGNYPSPMHETSLKLSAGKTHQISLQMLEHVFSPELHGEYCDANAANVTFEDHTTGEPVSFRSSLATCFYTEIADRLHDQYKCLYSRHPRPWHLRRIPRVENMTEVDGANNGRTFNRFSMSTLVDAYNQRVIDSCRRRQPCRYLEYSATATSNKWPQFGDQLASTIVSKLKVNGGSTPATAQLLRLANEFLSGNYSDRTEALFRRYISDSMLEVDISVASPLSPRKFTAYSYSWVAFLADIGGTLGLYIGCSLMTMCELLELFYNLFIGAIVARQAAAARRSQEDPAEAELEAIASPT